MVPASMVAEAFANTFTPMCLFLIWFGTVIGIIFGSIPGLSATMAVVLFLPLTFGMETTLFRFSNKDGEDPRKVYGTALKMVGAVGVLFLALVLKFLHILLNKLL